MDEVIGISSDQSSLDFLYSQFQSYYKNASFDLPDRFGRREFAFVVFGGRGMIRHTAFDKKHMFMKYLAEKAPQHVYYSSAYYQIPDAPTMNDKKWMGAELIFDLDSDHLPNATSLTYTQQLSEVKKEFMKLVEEFLLDDLGFNSKYLDLYFSGGRGYHCHVKDPVVFDLDSSERREIVDYITGRDIQDFFIFREQITGRKQYSGRTYPSGKSLTMPPPTQKGWKGRISRGIIEIVHDIKQSNNPVEKLIEYGVKKKDAEQLASELSEQRIKRIKEGMLDQSKTIRKFFLNSALRKTAVSLGAGETDEPVTCDIKRLIRLPFTLHGKTGFQVKKIDIDELKTFNPLNDTIVFSENPVKLQVHRPCSIGMNHQDFTIEEGEQEVPEFLAVFLIGGKFATIKKQDTS
ncbi:MAG: DNA primase catalytic subunit PriS [Thermoplasmatota archaeon]